MVKRDFVKVLIASVVVVLLAGCEGLKNSGHTEFHEAVSDSEILIMNEENTTTVKGNK